MNRFLLVLSLALPSAARAADLPTLRFDMGTGASPVAPGYLRITPASTFSSAAGYGWTSTGMSAFDVERPPQDPGWEGPAAQLIPESYVIYKEHNDLTRDGVRSKE